MTHLIEKRSLVRANNALIFGTVCGGLMLCAGGANATAILRLHESLRRLPISTATSLGWVIAGNLPETLGSGSKSRSATLLLDEPPTARVVAAPTGLWPGRGRAHADHDGDFERDGRVERRAARQQRGGGAGGHVGRHER